MLYIYFFVPWSVFGEIRQTPLHHITNKLRLNRGATPARVMLGVTTVLTMTTLISSTNASLPKISYVKSIDAYLAFCFFMVFASLIGKPRMCSIGQVVISARYHVVQ